MPKPLFNFDFSRRVALDTNTLLNAAFVHSGLARLTVTFLRRMGTPVYVPQITEQEAQDIAQRLGVANALGDRATRELADYITAGGFLFSPPPVGFPIPGINRIDEPIARSSRLLGAILLTDDIDLICQCRQAGIEAVQPWEVARSYRGDGALSDLSTIVRYLQPANDRGYAFARVAPGDWAGRRIDQSFTVVHVEGFCILAYLNASEEWSFSLDGVGSILLKASVLAEHHYVVCAQYLAGGLQTLLSLRVAEVAGDIQSNRQSFKGNPAISPNRVVSVGHRLNVTEHWNGIIKELTISDSTVAARTFRHIAGTEDLSPNPMDGDRLSLALAREALIIV
jgi:hypothetical protein